MRARQTAPRAGVFRGLLSVLLAAILAVLMTSPASAGDALLARKLTDRGIDMQKVGDHVGALSLFDAALVETEHPKIRYFRAKSLRALGKYDEALAEFEQIQGLPRVARYKTEIDVFMRDIKSERERAHLQAKLKTEQEARLDLEKQRQVLADQAEAEAIARIALVQSSIPLPSAGRAEDDTPLARLVPLVPSFASPPKAYEGAVEAAAYATLLDDYQSDVTIAKVLTAAAIVGVSVGVGLGANPLTQNDVGDGVRQAGLAIGVTGIISGLAAIVLWPDEPIDLRAQSSPAAKPSTPTAVSRR
ncbi:MAG: tetratricopeptide (TPR) repeat protein [Myxococcota bacterium]